MGRLAIFIDGGYLDKVLRYEYDYAEISYSLLADKITADIQPTEGLLRTYYYHCLPYQDDPPTNDQSERTSRQQSFFNYLNHLSRFEVKTGVLARHGPYRNGQYSYEQKMVDVLLSIDVVHLSANNQITDIALIAGDSDFVPAVSTAKDDAVAVWLYHGKNPHRELYDLADVRSRITQPFIDSILRN